MKSPIAECLVLVMPERLPLAGWARAGMLERYWAVFRLLRAEYGRLVVVTPGGEDERSVLAAVDGATTEFVLASAGHPPGAVVQSVVRAVGGAGSVVVRTVQIAGCSLGIDITRGLRQSGRAVGLIARTGFVWSKFVALEDGPHAPRAIEAAQREGALCRAADIVAGTTQRILDDLSWRYGLDPARCAVVPNYVLVDHPAMEPVERDAHSVLTVGPLVKRRRVDLLVRASAGLADSEARLTVVGDGPEAGALRALAVSLSAPVDFVPHATHAEVLARLTRCAVYVQASMLEGHPTNVLDAMACGAAVIVTESQGLGFVVHHGVSGLRVAPDEAAISHAMRDMLADPDWREILGASAARITRTNFGLPEVFAQEVDVHRRVVRLGAEHGVLRKSA